MYIYVYLLVFHFMFMNILEKLYIETRFENVSRPTDECKDRRTTLCLGMPSGHTETACVLVFLLLLRGTIGPLLALVVIVLVGAQRILSNMHTLSQVAAGMMFGLFYAVIYYLLKSNLYTIVFTVLVWFVLLFMCTVAIDTKVQRSVPRWLDKDLYSIVEKKRNHNIFVKMVHIAFPAVYMHLDQEVLMSWEALEKKLDKIIEILKKDKIDAIVGMKSGGAILGNYLGKKMGVPYYYTKVSTKCKGYTVVNSFNDVLYRFNKGDPGKLKMCEPIDVDLSGKRVLLVDEQICTGSTIVFAREYLLKEKKVGSLHIATLINWREDLPFKVVAPETKKYAVFPWGYDN